MKPYIELFIKRLVSWHQTLNELRKKGGIKLKLVGFSVGVILATVIIVSVAIIDLMSDAIKQKAFEVATSSVERIGEFSTTTLLERSYENKLNLNELIDDMKHSKIEGFLDIAIYSRIKEGNTTQFSYLAGFKDEKNATSLQDEKLSQALLSAKDSSIMREDTPFITTKKNIQAYRFTKPIMYTFQNREILLGAAVLYYDKHAINGIIAQVISTAVWITVGIVLITILIVYFAGGRFTTPILKITKAATQVSKGDLNVHLSINTNDEIQELSHEFNTMVGKLREREKMQKFVSTSTMSMISQDDRCDLVLGGEYRAMTFLFSDIRGFTAMSETKKPDEVVEIINFYLEIQSQIIHKYGGDIDKFVGDEIMASFQGDDGINNAIACGKEIQERLHQENLKRQKENLTVCHVGIGINHGEVIVGNMGSSDRMDFTSIGASVNMAARLCSHANAQEVLIEKETFKKATQEFVTQFKEPIKAKGITKPVEIVSIMPLKDIA